MCPASVERPPALEFETAAEHLCRLVPVLAPAATVGEARAGLVGVSFESASDLAVCEGGRLVGMVTTEVLLAAAEGQAIGQVMDPDPPVVHLSEDQELAALKAVQHGERSIAVVEDGRRFIGVIPPQRLLSVLLMEHHEDMARLATAVAIMLPWLISWLGADPAFGSGPLATVIQDLLSIVIYLGIAAAVLR